MWLSRGEGEIEGWWNSEQLIFSRINSIKANHPGSLSVYSSTYLSFYPRTWKKVNWLLSTSQLFNQYFPFLVKLSFNKSACSINQTINLYPLVYLVDLLINQLVNQSINQSIDRSINVSILSTCWINQSINVSILSTC